MKNIVLRSRIARFHGFQHLSVALSLHNSDIMTRINSVYGSQTSPVVLCMKNMVISTRITSIHGSQPSSVVLNIHNSNIMTRIKCLYGSQTSPVILCIKNMVISTRIISLHGSQTWPVVLCIQNKVINIRITNLYVSQPSSVFFACKTATFRSELQVSMCPRFRMLIYVWITSCLDPESLVSMGPSPHLWFFHAKQRLLDRNYNSLLVPDLTYGLLHAKQRDQHQNY